MYIYILYICMYIYMKYVLLTSPFRMCTVMAIPQPSFKHVAWKSLIFEKTNRAHRLPRCEGLAYLVNVTM